MVRDYVIELYSPAAASSRGMSRDGYAGSRDVSAWIQKVRAAWSSVRVSHVESSGVGDAPELGQQVEVRAVVELGELQPDDVEVQVFYGRVDEHDEIRDPVYADMRQAETVDGSWRYECAVPLERRGAFGYTVRVLPRHESVSAPADLDLVAFPHESTAYTAI
jgi:glycogen phosphorylase